MIILPAETPLVEELFGCKNLYRRYSACGDTSQIFFLSLKRTEQMKYSDDIDYLLAATVYLASSTYWWGRTPQRLANVLSLDETRLATVLKGYPGIFRQSKTIADNGQVSFSLQARYAHFASKDGGEPTSSDDIPPIEAAELKLVLEFIQKMAEHEKTDVRAQRSNVIAVGAAVISAVAALTVGTISLAKDSNKAPLTTLQCSPAPSTK
jgi:hypothetical protein